MDILVKGVWLAGMLALSACGGGTSQQSPGFSSAGTGGTAPFNEKARNITDQRATEGYRFNFDASGAFSEDAARIVRYEARNLPAGLSINPNTGEITGTTTEVGEHDIIVTAVYDNGQELDTDFTLIVADNGAPTLSEPLEDTTVATNQPATISVGDSFSDPEGGSLTLTVDGLPDGMSFDPATGEISGTPTVPGDYEITVTATDEAGESVSDVFTLTVADDNAAPQVLQPIPAQTATQGYTTSIQTASSFSDPEGGQLTYSAAGLPDGMSIDPATGEISGTPAVPGDYDVTVTATDPDGATASNTFPLRVNPNQAPVISPPLPDRAVQTGDSYSFDTGSSFSDPEGGALMFSATGLPAGASIDPQTGVITGTAGLDDTFDITVTAVDQVGATVSDSFQLIISADNQSPQNTSPIPDQTAVADENFSVTTAEHFSDPEGEPLTYSATGLPDGVTIDPDTGVISGTPTVPGDYDIQVTATDPNGASVSDDFVLTVEPGDEGTPTLESPIEDETAQAGEPKTVTTAEHFNDPDGQPLTFTATGLPDGMSIDPNTGEITGTPNVPGDYTIVVTATDPDGNSISDDFELTVDPADDGGPTLLSPIEDEQGVQNYPLEITTSEHFADTSGATLTYSAVGLPDGLSIDPGTGVITGSTPQVGDFDIEVVASNPQGESISDTFELAIEPNDAPEARAQPNAQSASSDQPYEYDSSEDFEDDPEGGALTFEAANLPPGLTIEPTTGVISGTPTTPGAYNYSVTASDPGGASATQVYNLTVGLPVVANDDLFLTDENTAVVVDVRANDEPNNQVDPTAVGGNSAFVVISEITVQPRSGTVAITNNGQNITYTPLPNQAQDDSFEYRVTDGITSDTAVVDVFVVPARIVFRSNIDGQTFQLYQANAGDNENPTLLTPPPVPLVANGVQPLAARGWEIDDINDRAFYISDQVFAQSFQMYGTDLSAQQPTATQQIYSEALPDLEAAVSDVFDLQVSPDKTRIVFRTDQGFGFNGRELYLVNVDAPGDANRIHLPFDFALYDAAAQPDYQWTSDSSAVIFRADIEAGDKFELYRANLDADSTITKINPPISGDSDIKGFIVSPDGDFLVYRSNDGSSDFDNLTLVDLRAALPNGVVLNAELESGSAFTNDGLVFSDDGRWLVFRARNPGELAFTLRAIDLDNQGGDLSAAVSLIDESVTSNFQIDSNSDYVYVIAALERTGINELFRVRLTQPGMIEKVSAELQFDVLTAVSNFTLSPDGQKIVYTADHDINTVNELYLVTTDALTQRSKLNSDFRANSDVQLDIEITRDSDKAVYIADPAGLGMLELYIVDFSFPGNPFKISQSATSTLDLVVDFHVTQVEDLQ